MTRQRRVFLFLAVLFLPPASLRAAETTVTRLRILVPDDAVVLIDGERTTLKGAERWFDTPALPAGKMFRYEIRARMDGKEILKEVKFRAGRTVEIDFRPDFRRRTDPPAAAPRRPYRPLRPLDRPSRRVYA